MGTVKVDTGGIPYLLWMGECMYDHRIDSMDDLASQGNGVYRCKICRQDRKGKKKVVS